MKKKGQIEVQFNWIYIAIVGAIILVIFLNIANGIRKSSRTELEIDAINYFDEIFTSLQGSENTEHSITLPGLEINVASDEDYCYEYSISDSEFGRRRTEYVSLFSPDAIKTRILSYSLGWDIPFRASYLLYLTSPEIAYFFVSGDDEVEILYEDLPHHLTGEVSDDSSEFENENYYKIRIVSSSDPRDLVFHSSIRKHKDTTAVQIMPDNDLYGTGTIVYYKKEKPGFEETGRTYYLDKATLFAAIYSENHYAYECNLKKSLLRLNMISLIFKKRTEALKRSNLPDRCPLESYDNAISLLSQIESVTSESLLTKETIDQLADLKDQLAGVNNEITRKSCPTVY
jgi:uncharacterized protein (UPF0333 family)